ncbi:MAG: cytochrome c/FTR1 family iron permease [Deltaproteobacteria bacterium]|nr:cytochrome c/FTR1 family iron permease [Deltaproteobacteria bacterium]
MGKSIKFFLLLFLVPLAAGAAADKIAPQRAVAILDYIAGDYQMAVAPEGEKILSDMEYREMVDFIDLVGHYLDSAGVVPDSALRAGEKNLKEAIAEKKPPADVRELALGLKTKLIAEFSIVTAPKSPPDPARGKEIYRERCAQCHGLTGKADTETAKIMDPPPPAFADPDVIGALTPFKVFNTITFGIDGTAMPSFANLSEEDRWAVTSFLFQPGGEVDEGGNNKKAAGSIDRAISLVRESMESRSLDIAVSAYLDGFEQSEAVLSAMGEGKLVTEVENNFMAFRNALRGKGDVESTGKNLLDSLEKSREALSAGGSFSPGVAFAASFTIIFREGLEAILLIAIILSVVSAMKDRRLNRWVHGSWTAALIVGFLTWLIARGVISGAAREGMEGWVSLVAAMVLIYVSFWIFAKRDVRVWKNFLIGKIRRAKNLGFLSVGIAAFLAVYREAFETILFFEALRLQAAGQSFSLGFGVIIGFAALAISSWLIFKIGKKIPLNLFFGASGIMLLFLAVVFAGEGIHSLQEGNFIPSTPIPFFTLPALGIFPSLESAGVQGILAGIFVAGLLWQEWVKAPREESRLEDRMRKTSLELFSLHELEEHLKGHLDHLKSAMTKGRISDDEVKEMVGHMEDLDKGIHHIILQLNRLHADIPRRFDEFYQEVLGLQGTEPHQKLLTRAEEFKRHLESLKSDSPAIPRPDRLK